MVLIYLLIILTGAAFGSFFNVCIWRIPRKESIILPASHCPNCHQAIKPWHNIPVISFIFLKGKCRYCGNPINSQYLIVELLTPLVWLLLFWRFVQPGISEFRAMNSGLIELLPFLRYIFSYCLIWLKYVILYSSGIIIFFIDLKHNIIPDRISLPLIVLGLGIAVFPQSDISILKALGGAAAGFSFLYLLALAVSYSIGKESLGGGDIKYITALGMFLGIQGVLFTIFSSATIALIMVGILRKDRSSGVPFGPFLVIGAFIYTMLGNWMLSSYLDLFY
ncbi:MAG: prepilin peptidase [Candidatus Cloacimonetes bacterium]|nr:prepilin peptidase [Candidatus Cloacimonadota bacterium]